MIPSVGRPGQGETPRPAAALGIVFALDIEADGLTPHARNHEVLRTAPGLAIHTGTIGGCRVAWTVAGVGVAAAAAGTALLVAGHRPRLLVTAGFAGALDPAFGRGALVVIDRVLRAGEPPLELAALPPLTGARGTIVTVDRPVADPAAKRALRESTGAALVDMESHAVASAGVTHGIPCVGIRVVSDAADERLPPEVAALARPQSPWRRLGAAVGGIGRRPGAVVDLWRLWEHAVVDSRRLGTALAELCGSASDP